MSTQLAGGGGGYCQVDIFPKTLPLLSRQIIWNYKHKYIYTSPAISRTQYTYNTNLCTKVVLFIYLLGQIGFNSVSLIMSKNTALFYIHIIIVVVGETKRLYKIKDNFFFFCLII